MTSVLKNFVLLFTSVVAALLIGELACRSLYEPPSNTISAHNDPRSTAYVRDDELGWVPRPSIQGTHTLRNSKRSTFATNSLATRNPEFAIDKPPGVERIVALGDSFTWGWGVDDRDAFTAQMEVGHQNRQVINLGVIGYGLRQEAIYFQRVGANLNADVLLLSICENDIEDATADFRASRASSAQLGHEPTSDWMRLKQLVGGTSRTYRVLSDAINSNKALARLAVKLGLKHSLDGYDELDVSLKPFLNEYPDQLNQNWRAMLAQLTEIRDLAAANQLRLVVAIIPALQSVDRAALNRSLSTSAYSESDFDLDRPYDAIEKFGRKMGIEVINPTAAFRTAQAQGDSLYLNGDMHFNEAGNKLFARVVSDYLDGTSVRTLASGHSFGQSNEAALPAI